MSPAQSTAKSPADNPANNPANNPAKTLTTVHLAITGDSESDALLIAEPLALVIGMLLDQQVPMEWAFRGPRTLKERLGADSKFKHAKTRRSMFHVRVKMMAVPSHHEEYAKRGML